jgi:hypothetical protein
VIFALLHYFEVFERSLSKYQHALFIVFFALLFFLSSRSPLLEDYLVLVFDG